MLDKQLDLSQFTYDLPEERIAKYPLENRSDSKLLHYDQGKINHLQFSSIKDLLPANSHLVFNDTKVIPARLIFHKETGARIEIFLLEPVAPSAIHAEIMSSSESCTWHCMIGNSKKWKINAELTLQLPSGIISAYRVDQEHVQFTWNNNHSFSEILEEIGRIPLPPYLNREVEETDKPRYQTVYSSNEGAVAAPTAGLHFTDEIINSFTNKNISTDYVTLHVSAGTFQPLKANSVEEHPMHQEQIVISEQNIEGLIANDQVIAVGTTSMRTLESLYWYGVILERDPEAPFFVPKLSPYDEGLPQIDKTKSLQNVLAKMKKEQKSILIGYTEIFIFPGYEFAICKGLVTNFHLPGSTLILLVAALIGEDWKKVYQAALNNEYRFLSYGDSSLLIP